MPISTLLVAVGAISVLSSFLAFLMVVADATIGNYGDVTVRINESDEHKHVVRGGRPLLSTLMAEQIFIPSACGGRGSGFAFAAQSNRVCTAMGAGRADRHPHNHHGNVMRALGRNRVFRRMIVWEVGR